MWARIVELMLGLWLALSPFIFGHAHPFLWKSDLCSAILIALFSLLSFNRHLSKMHLLNVLMGFWLIGVGYLMPLNPVPPGLENNILVGILLLMLGIVPSHCNEPPKIGV